MKTQNVVVGIAIVVVLVLAIMFNSGSSPPPEQLPPEAARQQTELEFVVWTYAIDMIQDNIRKFEATAPGVKVKLTDYNWGQYHDTLVANFAGGTGMPDVLYGSDHWLQEWASAGWLVPLKDVFPPAEVDALMKDMFPYTLKGMTYKGEIYGLPYYADPIAFVYNKRFYKSAGIQAPPVTWKDVLDHAKIIKAAGRANFPIGFGWSQQEPFSIEEVTAMLFSRGGQFFDEKLTPAFVGEGSVLAEHMKWVREALDQKLMDPESLTRDAVANQQAMMAGTQVYGLTRASGLAFWQDKAKSKEGGNFEIIPMPGKTHETLGFVRFYGVTKQLAARDQTAKDGAWKFLSYFGGPGPDGSWPVVRRWALEHGLGFGPMPLFKDAAIRESFGNWTDVPALEEMCKQAKTRKLSPWYASWDVFTRAELQRAYLGRTDVDAAVNNIAERWKTVQAEFAE